MFPDLLETLCTANEKTFTKNRFYREKAEKLVYDYIHNFLEAPNEQKKELKGLIFSCLEPYKTFIEMQEEAMRVSDKLTPRLIEKRLKKEPVLERLN